MRNFRTVQVTRIKEIKKIKICEHIVVLIAVFIRYSAVKYLFTVDKKDTKTTSLNVVLMSLLSTLSR